jgi:hypothetical protein
MPHRPFDLMCGLASDVNDVLITLLIIVQENS